MEANTKISEIFDDTFDFFTPAYAHNETIQLDKTYRTALILVLYRN